MSSGFYSKDANIDANLGLSTVGATVIRGTTSADKLARSGKTVFPSGRISSPSLPAPNRRRGMRIRNRVRSAHADAAYVGGAIAISLARAAQVRASTRVQTNVRKRISTEG